DADSCGAALSGPIIDVMPCRWFPATILLASASMAGQLKPVEPAADGMSRDRLEAAAKLIHDEIQSQRPGAGPPRGGRGGGVVGGVIFRGMTAAQIPDPTLSFWSPPSPSQLRRAR